MRHRLYSFLLTTRFRAHCLMMFFFFNDTATTEIYTLSLHDALPISVGDGTVRFVFLAPEQLAKPEVVDAIAEAKRSEEHTSELQSRQYLVCRLLLEKKKTFH